MAGDSARFSRLLARSPALSGARFSAGATRQEASRYFIEKIGHYINAGDTALHFAAAAYRFGMARNLVDAGADLRARNRRGTEPLHAAATGNPGSPQWDPLAQGETIAFLIEAGADPNAQNLDGATPLHRAVRTRCAGAVRVLLEHGADPSIHNKRGSTALALARAPSGRGGSGSPAAKAEQQEILRLLRVR